MSYSPSFTFFVILYVTSARRRRLCVRSPDANTAATTAPALRRPGIEVAEVDGPAVSAGIPGTLYLLRPGIGYAVP